MKISNENEIELYFHCSLCAREVLELEVSPKEYSDTQTGWTKQGIQVWCNRHNCNVLHIDFEGNKHPANPSRKTHQEDEE